MSASKPLRVNHSLDFKEENRVSAEERFLAWEGVQTRARFTHKEEEVIEWMEQLIRQKIPADTSEQLADSLANGRVLCRLVNVLSPGSVPLTPTGNLKRATTFLEQSEKLGVATAELFDPIDLIYKKNLVRVIYCLHSLAETCHQKRLVPFFTGSTSARKKQREEWRKKAKASLRRDFEGWKVSSELLAPILREEGEVSEVEKVQPEEDMWPVEDTEVSEVEEPEQVEPYQEDVPHIPTPPPSPIAEAPVRIITRPPPVFSLRAGDISPEKHKEQKPKETPLARPARKSIDSIQKATASITRRTEKIMGQFRKVDRSLVKLMLFWVVCIALWIWSWSSNHTQPWSLSF